MHRGAISLRKYSYRFDSHCSTGAHDAARDLTSIRNQHLVEWLKGRDKEGQDKSERDISRSNEHGNELGRELCGRMTFSNVPKGLILGFTS